MSDMPLVRADNISMHFQVGSSFLGGKRKTLKAVDNVSLMIRRGETFGLVGESGCGKTTSLRMINRMVEPTAGTVLIDGDDVAALDPVRLRRRIGLK